MQKINETYSIIKGSEQPLSCDVAIINGKQYCYIFEAGANDKIVDELNNIDKNKVLIISHFHQDHITNLNKINYQKLFIGQHTYKYTKTGEIVSMLSIEDGIKLHLFNIECSHAKGSIGLQVGDYAFIGDALAPVQKDNNYVYNVQKLKEEIDILSNLEVKYIVDSHNMENPHLKDDVIKKLNNIYAKRIKNNPYIIMD